tara:strand:+ start:196 stop:828 length:633 start_codon:yes stop_codon:yes gene_type:complete
MARSVQVLKNTTGSVCVKIEGDDAATTTLDPAGNYEIPANGLSSIKRLMWTMASGSITITWKAKGSGTDAVATRLSGSGNWNFMHNSPVLTNPLGLQIATISVTAGGSGYTSDPTVVIRPPTYQGLGPNGSPFVTATATAGRSGNAVNAVTVSNSGEFYTDTPLITFTGGAGSNAAATAVMDNATGAIAITKVGAVLFTLVIDVATPAGL